MALTSKIMERFNKWQDKKIVCRESISAKEPGSMAFIYRRCLHRIRVVTKRNNNYIFYLPL